MKSDATKRRFDAFLYVWRASSSICMNLWRKKNSTTMNWFAPETFQYYYIKLVWLSNIWYYYLIFDFSNNSIKLWYYYLKNRISTSSWLLGFNFKVRFAQCKTSATISDLKNSFTIVFSVWYNLEKHVFFVDRKNFFFGYPEFSVFWVFSRKTGFLDFFWARNVLKIRSAHILNQRDELYRLIYKLYFPKKNSEKLIFRIGSESPRFIQKKKSRSENFFFAFLKTRLNLLHFLY